MTPQKKYKMKLSDKFWKVWSLPFLTEKELQEALHYAAVTGQVWRAHFLLTEKKADVTTKDNLALRWAARGGHAELIEIFLDHGADINAKDGEPLIWAMQFGRKETALLLVEKGADLSSRHHEALRTAHAQNDRDFLKAMLASKQDLRAAVAGLLQQAEEANNKGLTALYAGYLADKRPFLPPPKGPDLR